MSYSVTLKVKIDGTNKYATVECLDASTTYNVCEMIQKSTGLNWHSGGTNLGLAKDVINKITDGMHELMIYSGKYKKYESPNGWGTVDSTIDFFDKIIEEWDDFRNWNKDIVDYVYLWVN